MKRVLLSALTVALLATGSPGAVAGPTEPPNSAQGRYVGLDLLTKGADYPDPGSDRNLVVDRAGTIHTVVGSASGLLYVTRSAAERRWQRRLIPGSGYAYAGLLALSPNGRRLYLAEAPCRINLVAKRTTALNFPTIRNDSAVIRRCESEEDDDSNWELRALVALPHGRVELLLNNEGDGPNGPDGLFAVTGRPGDPWHRERLGPSVGYGQPALMARDENTGWLYVAAGDIDFFSRAPGGAWTGPENLSPPTASDETAQTGVFVTALVPMHGRVWLGYQQDSRDAYDNTPALPPDGVFLRHRSRAGSWSPAVRPFGTDQNSRYLRLVADPKRHTLQALYANSDYANPDTTSGMYYARKDAGSGWTSPEQLTHWWHDVPLHLLITPDGNYRYDFQRN